MRKQFKRAAAGLVMAAMLTGCAAGQRTETNMEEGNVGGRSESDDDEADLRQRVPDFNTVDLDGNSVTNDIFAQADLTVVNIWGTFCGPCIDEMPDLAEWSEKMPENVQMVGMVIDIEGIEDTKRLELAKEIVETAGVEFVNLIANIDLIEITDQIIGVPTTFFVDREGNIVGSAIIGADVAAYQEFVEEYVNE